MDHLSTSSGRNSEATTDHEQSRISLENRDCNEMTLMRLRRLTRTVLCKRERHRLEARTLQRSNIIKFLEENLTHSSEQVRCLSLQLLCSIIPRLGNKTDYFLKPLLPKIFHCLKKNETKELKTKALHFLRGYFQHTRRLSGFIDNFVKLGIQNSDPDIQTSCCLGLNIIFDQDLGNGLYPQLVLPVINILIQKNTFDLTRAAYRALKCIHETVQDDRFWDLINMAHPTAAETYRSMHEFEAMDPFLTLEDNDCSSVISEYQIKRNYLTFCKDFGILDPNLLYQIQKTRNCERARAVWNLYRSLKQTPWTTEDLDPHLLDFLRIVKSFISDSNRLVQIYGFDILKEIINRVGFTLAPHIHFVAEILRQELISANIKIRKKVYRVLYKLMRCIHPMTVVWNLLKTNNNSIKEAIIMLIQNMLSHFSYHEIDMIALCNYISHYLEDSNNMLASCSKDCIILLLDMIRDCPAYRTEAVKCLLKNSSLSTRTLRDIGIIRAAEEDYQEDFESFSDEEITDQDSASIPESSTVTATASSSRSLSTAGEYKVTCSCACDDLNLVKSLKNLHKNVSCSHVNKKQELTRAEPSDISMTLSQRSILTVRESNAGGEDISEILDSTKSKNSFYQYSTYHHIEKEYKLNKKESPEKEVNTEDIEPDSFRNKQATTDWVENQIDSLNKIETNVSGKSSVTSSLKERLLSSNSASSSPFTTLYSKHECVANNPTWPNFTGMDDSQKDPYQNRESEYSTREQILTSDDNEHLNSGDGEKRNFISFHASSEVSVFCSHSEKQSGVQSGIQVDVLNNRVYNFNIMTIEHTESDKDSNATDDFDRVADTSETDETSVTINESRETPLENTVENHSYHKPNIGHKSMIPKFRTPKVKQSAKISKMSEFPKDFHEKNTSQSITEVKECDQEKDDIENVNIYSLVDNRLFEGTPGTEESFSITSSYRVFPESPNKESANGQENNAVDELNDKCSDDIGKNEFECTNRFEENVHSILGSEDIDQTPFMPKNRQLPRTPVPTKSEHSKHVKTNAPEKKRKKPVLNKRKAIIKKIHDVKETEIGKNTPNEEVDKLPKGRTNEVSSVNSPLPKTCGARKYASSPCWGGCQWRRDLEYASKAMPCIWVDKFEGIIKALKPFPSPDVAKNEMIRAIEDLHGNSWKEKEEAMLILIQLAKHHPEVVQDNTSKIAFVLSKEVKNFRQSVAGKAILTIGHLYEVMGKHFENKLRLVIAALLAKSGNRTLAAYFRLVIKTLFKIMNSSPQKAAMAFIYEGYKHTNKAARETAAQFLAIITESLGPESSLAPTLSSHMLKCAATFVFDSSALTRYCGKRMLKVLMSHPDFEKIKDHHLDIDTSHNLSKVLEQIASKGVGEDILPISLID